MAPQLKIVPIQEDNPPPPATQPREQAFEARSSVYVHILIIFLASSIFTHGYTPSLFSPCGKEYLEMHYDIYDEDEHSQIFGNLNMLVCAGCLFGALMGGVLSDKFGRKPLYLYMLGIKVIVLFLYMIYSIPLLYFNRILDGLTIGITGGFLASYTSEITPVKFRVFAG